MKHFSDALFEDYLDNKQQTLVEEKLDLSQWNKDMNDYSLELVNLIKFNKDGSNLTLIKELLNKLVKTYKTAKKSSKQITQAKNESDWFKDPASTSSDWIDGLTIECSGCGKKFSLKKLFIKIREGDGRWVCPTCGDYLEIPEAELFSSKLGQCQDCLEIYAGDYLDYSTKDCKCGGEIKQIIGVNRDISSIKKLIYNNECASCGRSYSFSKLVQHLKNSKGMFACPECKKPFDKLNLPDSYKGRVKECKYCGGVVLKTVKECPQCKSDEFQDYK